MMNPLPNHKLIDVACGTGDIAKIFLNKGIKILKLLVSIQIRK